MFILCNHKILIQPRSLRIFFLLEFLLYVFAHVNNNLSRTFSSFSILSSVLLNRRTNAVTAMMITNPKFKYVLYIHMCQLDS